MPTPFEPTRFDVIVIGLGAMGAAALWELSRRSPTLRILGLEQFDIPHARGSSHGQSRLIRLAYYEHPDYVPLLRRAWDRWRLLEREEHTPHLLHQTGGLYIGPPGSELVQGSLSSARRHNLAHQHLRGPDISRRWPLFQSVDDMEAVFEEQAGYLRPEACVAAFVTGALRRGAQVRARTRVLAIDQAPHAITVQTDTDSFTADRVILTAGAWSADLLPLLRGRITVTRQTLAWFWPARNPDQFTAPHFPSWCLEVPQGGLVYGSPLSRETDGNPIGLKVAHHFPGQPCHPDTVDRSANPPPEDWAILRRTLAHHLPAANGAATGFKTCLYSNSPDHHFFVDFADADKRLLLAAGFSGHGFKFASVIGEALADLAILGQTALPIHFLRVGRDSTA